MNDNFYRAFEERFRGPRFVIKTRLEVYSPFIAPLLRIYQDVHALDLGCGRGEWLELLSEWGFHPLGVDQDSGMLAACDELMLNVERGDAIAYLRALPSESQVIITAFHFVEHVPFDVLRVLASEAMRVLKPGGLLIMETPNQENLVVATRNFYLDPTHQRPIPSELLAFVAEHAGFVRVKTIGLQEPKDLIGKIEITLADVFEGASPDYGIIAQKNAASDVLTLFEDAFGRSYGLSQGELLRRWDCRIQQIEDRSRDAQIALQRLYESRSWRWTQPLRDYSRALALVQSKFFWFKNNLKAKFGRIWEGSIVWLTFSPSSGPRRVLKNYLLKAKQFIATRPMLKSWILDILSRFPALKARLKRVGSTDPSLRASWTHVDGPGQLSPRAKQIYADLKAAIDRQRKENA
jgi:O-antigen chain-terminating methyltransferase